MNTDLTRKTDWTIHAVYDKNDSKKPVDMHTHGLEKHNIRNICMECPSKDLINYCAGFINHLAWSMIDGEKYNINETHLIDNAENYMTMEADVYDVFDLAVELRDNGEGEEEVYVADYWFDEIFFNPYNELPYKFYPDTKKFEILRIAGHRVID